MVSRALLIALYLALPALAAEPPYTADGRLPAEELYRRIDALHRDHGWQTDIVYNYPGPDGPVIRAWRTPARGSALWIVAGIHGEEPAGPNALAQSVPQLAQLARRGVPMVIVPLANPVAYRNNWRYPNTPERDWRGPGYSIGDSEYLLPDLETGKRPRAAEARGPDTRAFTGFVLRYSSTYPPELVIDLHEDELSREGYVYIQAPVSGQSSVATEVVRLLQVAGTPLRMSGVTRFDEPIVNGLSTRDAQGQPFRDGSVDELFSAATVMLVGRPSPGPAARTVLVIETPAGRDSPLKGRVVAHAAVLNRIADLWRLNGGKP
jgi:hypothetical protein